MRISVYRKASIKSIHDLTQEEIARWDSLHGEQDACRKAFLSYAYALSVASCGASVYVIIGSIEDNPSWFLPMQRHVGWIGRFGVFEPVGGVMSDYFGAVAAKGVEFTPQEIFAATRGRIRACLFSHLDETQKAFGLQGSEKRIGLRTRLGVSAEEYWELLRKKDKKLVYDTERREKKLIKEQGEICFEWKSKNGEADLASLIEFKKAQYTRTGKSDAPLFAQKQVALLEYLSKSEALSCEGVLSVMRCGSELVAAHFGLRCYENFHIWFPVYNEKYAAYSPGRILLKHIINESIARGVQVLDRGEGDSQSKRDFSNEEHEYYRGYWQADSWSAHSARIAIAIYWRL